MHKTKLISAAALVAVCALCTSPTLSAATLGPLTTTTPIPLTTTDWSSSLDFPQFNPALGTLTSVELDLDGHLETTVTVNNNALSGSSGTAKTEVEFTVQDAGINLTAPEIDLLSPAFAYFLGTWR